ncbi:hypothetical protein AN958_12026 [Leucoagaricus sp. SymC.cos]|nr:hypothetical protein AN958_12026 [Leucoagaricus sp. SymC.cos]
MVLINSVVLESAAISKMHIINREDLEDILGILNAGMMKASILIRGSMNIGSESLLRVGERVFREGRDCRGYRLILM